MNKKYLISTLVILAMAGCARYSSEEQIIINKNVEELKKEFVGKQLYLISKYSYIEDRDCSRLSSSTDYDNVINADKLIYENSNNKSIDSYCLLSEKNEHICKKIGSENGLSDINAFNQLKIFFNKFFNGEKDNDGDFLMIGDNFNCSRKEIEEEEEKKKKEIEEAKKFIDTYLKDCDQAVKKAENYKKSIDYDNLYNLSKYRVVDFAKDGVFINYCSEYSCYRYFVYTKDTNYANGDLFNYGGVYYKRDGVYKYTTTMGGTNSVAVLKPTKHKIIDVDVCKLYGYSYLKNKDVKCNEWFLITSRYKYDGPDNLKGKYFCRYDNGKLHLSDISYRVDDEDDISNCR